MSVTKIMETPPNIVNLKRVLISQPTKGNATIFLGKIKDMSVISTTSKIGRNNNVDQNIEVITIIAGGVDKKVLKSGYQKA